MTAGVARFAVEARFASDAVADAAVTTLERAGFRAGRAQPPAGASPGTERVFWRIVVQIVIWSTIGTAIGAAGGLALALAGIGPDGTGGIVLQTVSWGIFGHLIAGLWAGYVVLTNRTSLDLGSGDRPLVRVRCRDRAEIERARAALASAGGQRVSVRVFEENEQAALSQRE